MMLESLQDAWKEDVEQRKEISYLKKKDQQENLKRSKNFYMMYKQKLIEKIDYKMLKADLVKINKEDIKNIYETQMLKINDTNRNMNYSSMY